VGKQTSKKGGAVTSIACNSKKNTGNQKKKESGKKRKTGESETESEFSGGDTDDEVHFPFFTLF
jgi:hypothetical protein